MKGRDVVVEGGKVSGTGLALGCAPVEQVREESGDWRPCLIWWRTVFL